MHHPLYFSLHANLFFSLFARHNEDQDRKQRVLQHNGIPRRSDSHVRKLHDLQQTGHHLLPVRQEDARLRLQAAESREAAGLAEPRALHAPPRLGRAWLLARLQRALLRRQRHPQEAVGEQAGRLQDRPARAHSPGCQALLVGGARRAAGSGGRECRGKGEARGERQRDFGQGASAGASGCRQVGQKESQRKGMGFGIFGGSDGRGQLKKRFVTLRFVTL